ncbi:MAG: TolC family protein [Planctomycetota bacterium]|jgi:cobalt-zinc-cadmium efflux system outer membrane protein|nr:TolC family protein [Planctomycetota bacterium]
MKILILLCLGYGLAAADLDALVAYGLERHPALAAARERIDATRLGRDAATVLPDPEFSIAPLGAMAQTAAGEVTLMMGLRQRFPTWGSRRAQGALVDAAVMGARAEERAAAVNAARDIRRAWWVLYEAEAAVQVLEQQRQAVADLARVVEARIAANAAGSADLLRLQVESGRLAAESDRLAAEVSAAQARLRASLVLDADQALPKVDADPLAPIDADLLALARQFHPGFARNDAARADALAGLDAARSRARPGFSVFANYNIVDDTGLAPSATGEDQWWVGVGMSVPLWQGSYGAGTSAAEGRSRAAVSDRAALDAWLRGEVAAARALWIGAGDQYRRYNDEIVPRARQALAASRSAYGAGTGSFTDLMVAWQQVLGLDMQTLRLRRQTGVARSEVLAVVGLVLNKELEGALQ